MAANQIIVFYYAGGFVVLLKPPFGVSAQAYALVLELDA